MNIKKNDIVRYLRAEFVAGRSWFDWLFLCLGITIQIIVFSLHPERPLAVVSGIAGIISVILCSQGKISTYLFGFVQIITYLILCYEQRLYAEVGMNMFYFFSQIYGIYVWRKNYSVSEQVAQLQPRRLKPTIMAFVVVPTAIIVSVVVGFLLKTYTDDTQPWLDSFTTIPAIIAQILMVLAYKEHWYFWLLIDILSIMMWINAANWCITAQYAFWCVNCVYGWRKWSK
ncbi:MAG: nicotinamide mononucleotide transporter [Paludibacteraceae bacterium]|nr:nicotinamide mononucleotide transporter [Paludibacteraceae bacterium]